MGLTLEKGAESVSERIIAGNILKLKQEINV